MCDTDPRDTHALPVFHEPEDANSPLSCLPVRRRLAHITTDQNHATHHQTQGPNHGFGFAPSPTGAVYATDPRDTVTWPSSDASWCARPTSPTCRTDTPTARYDTQTQGGWELPTTQLLARAALALAAGPQMASYGTAQCDAVMLWRLGAFDLAAACASSKCAEAKSVLGALIWQH